jgi:carboxyl-terminal processing protease
MGRMPSSPPHLGRGEQELAAGAGRRVDQPRLRHLGVAVVTRLGGIFLLLLALPAHGETAAPPDFGTQLAASVYASGLAFMQPRTLDPETISQLTIWGLNGLTALDPDLLVSLQRQALQLSLPGRVLTRIDLPRDEKPDSWATLAANLADVAWAASPRIRRAGTTGIITNFFDEIFNHLDPYSRYVPPEEAVEDRAHRSGSAGVGVTLMGEGNRIVVESVIADGPAAAAGIHAGDMILSVNGQRARSTDLGMVGDWLAGPEGTKIWITLRGREGRIRTVPVTRANVPPETVFAERLHDALLIRITDFNRETSERVAHVLTSTLRSAADTPHPVSGIILDLRGNRGGLVEEAIGVADEFLNAGIIAAAAGRDPDATRVWWSDGSQLADDLPVIVTVDGRTASAAEIVSAALADRGRAVVVGSATLGKGLVQTIAPLPDGGELYVTWSRVLAPRGWPLQGLGVMPQVCTSGGRDELESQLASLDAGTQPMADTITRSRAARAPVPPAQVLAIRGACPAAEGSDADLAAAEFLIQHPAAYVTALLPPLRGGGQASAIPK